MKNILLAMNTLLYYNDVIKIELNQIIFFKTYMYFDVFSIIGHLIIIGIQ